MKLVGDWVWCDVHIHWLQNPTGKNASERWTIWESEADDTLFLLFVSFCFVLFSIWKPWLKVHFTRGNRMENTGYMTEKVVITRSDSEQLKWRQVVSPYRLRHLNRKPNGARNTNEVKTNNWRHVSFLSLSLSLSLSLCLFLSLFLFFFFFSSPVAAVCPDVELCIVPLVLFILLLPLRSTANLFQAKFSLIDRNLLVNGIINPERRQHTSGEMINDASTAQVFFHLGVRYSNPQNSAWQFLSFKDEPYLMYIFSGFFFLCYYLNSMLNAFFKSVSSRLEQKPGR